MDGAMFPYPMRMLGSGVHALGKGQYHIVKMYEILQYTYIVVGNEVNALLL